jgi:histidine triad (HIT) family protein
MDKNCIFCRIISGEAPATIYFQDDLVIAFQDIHPAAPVHILIVPRAHIPSINDLVEENADLIGHMFITAGRLAKEKGIADTGYRLIINNGPDAKQAVFHLHLHLLGGRPMRYPMG